ncbi:hypothetical protein [Legionella tunisiensis]|uniref:hypothetical protein n=1 Tax=Legionella tunisiensis TaxID=1034944 RepID=UPI00030B210F|nr:hypothetical protein [Legionella tunisiensis]
MRFNVEEYGLDPKVFLEAVIREMDGNNEIPCEAKAPFHLLGMMITSQYEMIEMPRYDTEKYRKLLATSDQRIKDELDVEVDNVLPYILQAGIKSVIDARQVGNLQNIYACVKGAIKGFRSANYHFMLWHIMRIITVKNKYG